MNAAVGPCAKREEKKSAGKLQVTVAFAFAPDWLRKWREFLFNQSPREVMQTVQQTSFDLLTPFLRARLIGH